MPIIDNTRATADGRERTLRKHGNKDAKSIFPSIGRIYSIMVVELEIKKPDFQGFLEKLNEYLKWGHDSIEPLKNENDCLHPSLAKNFAWYLDDEWLKISGAKYNKIMRKIFAEHSY